MSATTGFSLKELTKRRLISDMVRYVQPAGKWKIMIVDPISMKLLNHSLKMFDILDENVTLVEMITKRRQPYPNLEAIYFLSPTPEAIQHFIIDFCPGGGKKPLYASAHLFFVGVLPDQLMDRITQSGAARYIKNLKELYVDFLPLEQRVFSLDSPASFFRLFSPEAGGLPAQSAEMGVMAQRLTSLLVTLGDFPTSDNTRSARFANMLLAALEHHSKIDSGFPPGDTNKSTLIIVDRSMDMNAPLLHEFTYQAMAYDLLPMDDGKYLYAFKNADGTDAEKEVPLDDNDVLWVQLRHKHIAETTQTILAQFNKFLSENKAANAAMGGSGQGPNLKDLKDTLAAMPQFQEMKQKYSIHINLAQECMTMFERKKLNETAMIEQNLACNELPDGGKPKNIVSDLVPILDDPALTPYDKARLLMLFIIHKEGVQDDDRRKLLEHANIGLDLSESITNMALLGDGKKEKRAKKDTKKKAGADDDGSYELSRYQTMVKTVLEDQVAGTLDQSEFPYLGPAPSASDASAKSGGTSLRSTKPSWQNKKGAAGANDGGAAASAAAPKGGRIILFSGKEVLIGSTHVMTPNKVVDDLKNLRDPSQFVKYNPTFGYGEGPKPLPEPTDKERKKMADQEAKGGAAGSSAQQSQAQAAEGGDKKKKKLFGIF
ncbi:Sec1-like protein [Catenaria anguillulae PL171]|uniref:Sec1-like protein n=1 Tax=Catenaria anguillulae PL171 TaxID=765915 RepID=A0A1Y2HRF0_9FUNG|nr:Sec1-like protein [Catenaria anguillulae PL171]